MKIEKKQISVRELFDGYKETIEDNSVVGYHGKLYLRPKFQRQFVYDSKKREAVINSIRNNFPISIIYWGVNPDGTFDCIDGQQRQISICQYVNGEFSINYQYFFNLTKEEQEQILDYKLDVYLCDGTDKERLDWFKIINIAGVVLNEQELRNAVYAGQWLSDAKKRFSMNNCVAYKLASQYLSGSSIRQDYLQAVLLWAANSENKTIEEYMAEHQNDENADKLLDYFKRVIEWVKAVFPNYRKEMKSVQWGILYNKFHEKYYSSAEIEEKISKLMRDDDVTKKAGIYEYVLGGEERVLSIRAFTENMKREAYERQGGICPVCMSQGGENASKVWKIEEMQGDHIIPWSKGGKTTADNCQMLCRQHNNEKGGK